MPTIYLSDEDRNTISGLLRGEVATLNDDGAGTYRRLAELFEKAPDEHAKLLERYEELLFAQRAGKLALGEEEELARLESDLGALVPERLKYEQDMAFFADLLRKRLGEEE